MLLDQPELEMTECVERVYRDAGARILEPTQLRAAVLESLAHPERLAERRAHYRESFYDHHGTAGHRAAQALLDNVEHSQRARRRDVDQIYTRMRRLEIQAKV